LKIQFEKIIDVLQVQPRLRGSRHDRRVVGVDRDMSEGMITVYSGLKILFVSRETESTIIAKVDWY